MKKKVFLLIIGIIVLSGCVTNHKKSDIEEYIDKKYALNDYSVSKTYEEIKDKDGYIDKLWTIKDKDNNIEFHVLDNYYYGMESVNNTLIDDYSESIYLKNNKKNGKISVKEDELYGTINDISLECKYNNKSEIKTCYDDLRKIYDTYYMDYNSFDLDYSISYANEEVLNEKSFSTRSFGKLSDLNNNVYDELLTYYFMYGYSYKVDNILNEMTNEEISNLLKNSETNIIYEIDDNKNILKKYDDIIGIRYGYGLSFSSLYYLLKDKGFDVTGNKDQFTVSYSENSYEFSTSFNNYIYTNNDGIHYGYYYIKNGEKIPFAAYWYKFLDKKEIEEMFGIKLYILQNQYKDKYIVDERINTN